MKSKEFVNLLKQEYNLTGESEEIPEEYCDFDGEYIPKHYNISFTCKKKCIRLNKVK